jgi:ankyrin repeat protein
VTTVEKLLAHGGNVHLRRSDGATAWLLAKRAGYDEVARLLERAGAEPQSLSPSDELLAACGRGDAEAARRLSTAGVVALLAPSDTLLLSEAAAAGRPNVVQACIAAGFDVDQLNDRGATALHEAAINGYSAIVRSLLGAGADHRVKDPHHHSTAMGWAHFGADFVQNPEGRYEDTVRALRAAGAEVRRDEHVSPHLEGRGDQGQGPGTRSGGQ